MHSSLRGVPKSISVDKAAPSDSRFKTDHHMQIAIKLWLKEQGTAFNGQGITMMPLCNIYVSSLNTCVEISYGSFSGLLLVSKAFI